MEKKEKMGIRGKIELVLKDKDGKVKKVVRKENLITALMDAQVANAMSSQSAGAIGYMGLGSGSGQTSASTGLATPLGNVALDSTTQGTAANDNDVIYVATFPAGTATGAVTEAGLLLGNNNTTLMTYDDFDVVNKGANDSIVLTWTVTFGAS
ncbi:MAG: hypothetical protein PHH57_07170 [Candidatus Omnitrophica bacterium]|jgi:hypothetical protein|nr:hypothetical protein [Candidatus Omnitrophota bacterium]